MPSWIVPIVNFLSKRFAHFGVYLIIGLLTIGIPYKLFIKPDNKTVIQNGGKVINVVGEKEVPILGCSIYKIRLKTVWQ